MLGWIHITAIAASIGFLFVFAIELIRWWCRSKQRKAFPETKRDRAESFQTGIAQLHQVSVHHHHHVDLDNKNRTNYSLFRRGVSTTRPLFNWADNPSLVTDAVENGWSRFAFTNYNSSPSIRSTRSALLGVCASGDHGRGLMEVEISWEVCQGSADFMQKIRLNSGLKKMINTSNFNSSMAAISVIKTALPLPGPPLGNSSFPQEAYFEITILSSIQDHDHHEKLIKVGKATEGEKTKLIQESFNGKVNSDSLVHVSNRVFNCISAPSLPH